MKNLVLKSVLFSLILLCNINVSITVSANTSKNKKYTSLDSTSTTNINWRKPSEKKAYPKLGKYKHAWIYVSRSKHRVYIYSNQKKSKKLLYTMYCSCGTKKSPTPKGTYHIQAERGYSFYNASSREGARHWVSWKGHGIYLFHSVPVNKYGKYVISEAKTLGKKNSSHGCVRLSVADANWVYNHVPYGMKVVIN